MGRRTIALVLTVAAVGLAAAGGATAGGPTTVVVQANAPTTDTGISLTAGTTAIVTASGAWDVCGGGCASGPAGATNGDDGFCPGVAGHPAGELIGSLDGGLTFFDVGSGPTQVSGNGELLLGPNDCADYGDNSGSVTATIVVYPTSKDACKQDGWQNLQTADGTPFHNQGDCVSYVNTGK
jgi:hypothetical protein